MLLLPNVELAERPPIRLNPWPAAKVSGTSHCQASMAGGKFDRIPSVRMLERLHQRNEYLIASHHPLRETLMRQTGMQPAQRAGFLYEFYQLVQLSPTTAWDTDSVTKP